MAAWPGLSGLTCVVMMRIALRLLPPMGREQSWRAGHSSTSQRSSSVFVSANAAEYGAFLGEINIGKTLSTDVAQTTSQKEDNLEPLMLEIPNQSHQREFERVMDKWEALEDNIQPELMRRGNTSYDKWLEYCEDDRTIASMLLTHIPATLLFLVNRKQEILGGVVINHADTKHGHLHIGIVPWLRGKGYGTAMVALALKECQRKGIGTVHIVPNNQRNPAAIKTILNNGGYLLDEFVEDGRQFERYEILL